MIVVEPAPHQVVAYRRIATTASATRGEASDLSASPQLRPLRRPSSASSNCVVVDRSFWVSVEGMASGNVLQPHPGAWQENEPTELAAELATRTRSPLISTPELQGQIGNDFRFEPLNGGDIARRRYFWSFPQPPRRIMSGERGDLSIGSPVSSRLPPRARLPSRSWPSAGALHVVTSGFPAGDLHPVDNAPMLGAHKERQINCLPALSRKRHEYINLSPEVGARRRQAMTSL